jgi:hypothetical protein
MPQPTHAPSSTESTDPTTSTVCSADARRRWSTGAAWCFGRALVVGGLIAWAASPLGLTRPTVFAEPNAQYQNPTPTPYNWYSGQATMTPTPYGWNPQQNGQYTNGGSVNPSGGAYQDPNNPYPNNQFPNNQYPNNQSPNTQYPNGGLPGSSIQPSGGVPGGMPAPAGSPNPGGGDPCYGDELITFAPEAPRVGDELLVAVTSSHAHPYGRLAGTEMTQFTRERPGQRGYVWEWIIRPTYPGQHEYTFYVDSTVPCQKIQLTVRESLATKTPRPTKTPTPYGFDNNNNSNGNNNNSNNNGGTVPYRDPYQFTLSGDAYNCSFFYSQGEAQRVLRANASDPNRLDSEDGVEDGVACTTYHNWQYSGDGDYNPVQRTNATATSTTGAFNPYNYLNQGNAWGCRDFASQANAQAVLRADPSDPNQLDTNPRNGIACETNEAFQDGVPNGSMQPPYDSNAVSR